ncbi:MAG: ribosome assembly RNA-binding protein YhbY [Gammaproteobacteria bacterium]|nr:ribosome assembly RNA-binding protein YhbY [Gammaproteobacteria bacterium]
MKPSEIQKRKLRGKGHQLKPVVMIGNAGLTDAICEEIDRSLDHHELIKIKVSAGDRDSRSQMITEFCQRTQATLIQSIGHIALIYREKAE